MRCESVNALVRSVEPGATAMSFSSVSVVGAGPTGIGIALVCAAEGFPVWVVRAGRSTSLDAVRARLERRLALSAELGEVKAGDRSAIASRIRVVRDPSQALEPDLVIDAMQCDPKNRRAMLATLEGRLSDGAVLATGCEREHLSAIAEVVRRPDQLVGMRFEVPVTRSPRVDLAFLPETAPGAIAACRAFVSMLRKTPRERASVASRIGYREWLSVPSAAAG